MSPTQLIVARESLPPSPPVAYCGLDPEIETLELVRLVPLPWVRMAVWRRRGFTIRVRMGDGGVTLHELGERDNKMVCFLFLVFFVSFCVVGVVRKIQGRLLKRVNV